MNGQQTLSPLLDTQSASRCARSGALSGVMATLAFTVIHDIFISDIWVFAPVMVAAGALCGLCLGWSYHRLVGRPAIDSWLGYNLRYVVSLLLLGLVSVLVFEPAMSMAALMALNGPPDALIRQAMPLTLVYTLATAVLITLTYRPTWRHFGAVLLTNTVLVLLLGLNVSVLGLVSMPGSAVYLIAEFLGLIVVINVFFVTGFILLERRSLTAA